MRQNTQRMLSYFKRHGGIARFSSIIKSGFHSDTLHILEKEGKIEKIAKGLYRIAGYKPDAYPDFTLASLQAPRGIICLISALAFHEVTTEIPGHVDIAIPAGSRANKIDYPPVQFYRFSRKTWNVGIETRQTGGHEIKVYNLAKTIADCFKFRNKIGANIAREALKTAITEKGIKPKDIMKYAKICRVDKIIKPMLETLI
ncbi:MAG: type IV toxin-antitoxin system AbiEi family antitoxin domain-containing protein [Elusimicrobiales bacterium]|nr:type IV toxin-antitoxin system AbiEi family antitoxin domain-containing protein [Elusimicrobiales bacterium]